jgi:hypothetical protein
MPHDIPKSLSDDAAQLAYARHTDGEIIHISRATRGRACNCVCPACNGVVVARKGALKAHHFAHKNLTNCSTGPETAVHELAKQVVAYRRQMLVPQKIAAGAQEPISFEDARSIDFDEASIEDQSHEALIPDVLLRLGPHKLAIEIYVTHRCPPEKIEKYRAHRLAALEIDLSALPRDALPEMIAAATLSGAPRHWLYHPRIERETKRIADAERRQAAEQARKRAIRLALEDAYDESIARPTVRKVQIDPSWPISSTALVEFLQEDYDGGSCFVVPSWRWQAEILNFLADRRDIRAGYTIDNLLSMVRKAGLIHPIFHEVSAENQRILATIYPCYFSPYQAVRNYLSLLVENEIVAITRMPGPRRYAFTEVVARMFSCRAQELEGERI